MFISPAAILLERFLWAALVPLLAWVFGIFFLAVPTQTADLLTQALLPQLIFFHLSVFAWAITCWFWTRWALNLQPVRLPEEVLAPDAAGVPSRTVTEPGRTLRNWIPRLPLLFSAPVALLPLFRAHAFPLIAHDFPWLYEYFPWIDQHFLWILWILVNAIVLFSIEAILIVFVIFRFHLPGIFRRDMLSPPLEDPDWTGTTTLHECLNRLPFGRSSYLLWLGAFVALCAAIGFSPVRIPAYLGAPAVAFLSLSALTGVFAFATIILRRCAGLPGLALVAAWAVVVGYLGREHGIRTVEKAGHLVDEGFGIERGQFHHLVANRPGLPEALNKWLEACNRDRRHPRMVIVATAGGASRAALWTESVLHTAEQEVGADQFRRALFALSAVSGGSLGAAAYVASLPPEGCASAVDKMEQEERLSRTRKALSQNYLSAPIAVYLTTDVLTRFVPLPIPDRASALERAWEVAWSRSWHTNNSIVPHAADFDHSFLGLWMRRDDEWSGNLPLLFLNGTHANSGLPILTSPVQVTQDQFPLALDLLDIIGRDIRLSTAVTDSARFPVVTPGGELFGAHGEGYRGDVMDGGYVENFGADTAHDLLRAIAAWAQKRSEPSPPPVDDELRMPFAREFAEMPQPRPFKPHVLVIQISSDPSVPVERLQRCGPRSVDTLPLGRIEGEPESLTDVLGPLTTVVEARGARGARTAGDLMRDKCPGFGAPADSVFEYVHFALCDQDIPGYGKQDSVIGLNWALSEEAVNFLAPLGEPPAPLDHPDLPSAMRSCGNEEQLRRLREWFDHVWPGDTASQGGRQSAAPAEVTPAVSEASPR